jgi:hypothetical protein
MTAYTLDRNNRGELRARTVITLGFDSRELHIETRKGSRGGVECSAAVFRRTADGLGLEHAFGRGGDFRRTLKHAPNARATERTLRTVHEECTADARGVTWAALEHYGRTVTA